MSARDRWWTLGLGLLATLLPLLIFHQYFSGDALLYRYDHGQLQLPRFEILGAALREHGQIPLWQTELYAGAPFHANIEVPTLYAPILALLLRFEPLLAMNLTVLGHLAFASLGMFCLVRRLARGDEAGFTAAGAFVAALCFALNPYTRLDHFNLVIYGAAHAWIPWILLSAESLLRGPSPARGAGLLALCIAMQLMTGGLYVVIFTSLLVVAWFVILGLLSTTETRRRALVWGAAAAVLAASMVAAKALPFRDWVARTNRAGDAGMFEAPDFWNWSEAWLLLRNATGGGTLLVLGLVAIPFVRRRGVGLALGLSVFAFLCTVGRPYELLHALGYPFDVVRVGYRRAWTLGNVLLPLAIGVGVNAALARSAFLRERRALTHGAMVLGGLALLPLLLPTGRHSQMLEHPYSYDEIVARHQQWPRAAKLAGDDWRAAYFDQFGVATKCEQFITTALGVETPAGFLGYIFPSALARHLEWRPDGGELTTDEKRRRLRTLSARVTVEGDSKGVVDLASDPPYAFTPRYIDGERVGVDKLARSRAIRPSFAIGLISDDSPEAPVDSLANEVLYRLLDSADYPLRSCSVIEFETGRPPEPEEWAALDAVIDLRAAKTEPDAKFGGLEWELEGTADGALTEDAVARLGNFVDRIGRANQRTASLTRENSDRAHVARPEAERAEWIVLSETWAINGGWRADASGRSIPLRRADGVATAVLLLPGEHELDARYRPRSIALGWLIGALGLLLSLALLCVRGRAS